LGGIDVGLCMKLVLQKMTDMMKGCKERDNHYRSALTFHLSRVVVYLDNSFLNFAESFSLMMLIAVKESTRHQA
jgi:hypothetical protein